VTYGRSRSGHSAVDELEASMVGFDPIVRILLGVVKRGRDQLIDHRALRGRTVGHDLDRFTVSAERGLEEPSRRSGVASW
jgi:hypothetical protein